MTSSSRWDPGEPGRDPQGTYPGKLPNTRMGTANLVRTALASAQAYAKKRAGAEDKRPPRTSSGRRWSRRSRAKSPSTSPPTAPTT